MERVVGLPTIVFAAGVIGLARFSIRTVRQAQTLAPADHPGGGVFQVNADFADITVIRWPYADSLQFPELLKTLPAANIMRGLQSGYASPRPEAR